MAYHDWSTNWPYFGDVDDAASYIRAFMVRWGRVPVRDAKEKFGQVRVYCSFGWSSVHDITHPGWAYIQYRQPFLWLYWRTLTLQGLVFKGLNVVLQPYHQWLYRLAHKRACQKWPHIKNEILGSPDFEEYLKGL
jgi:hypothetical protein